VVDSKNQAPELHYREQDLGKPTEEEKKAKIRKGSDNTGERDLFTN
jgi:hypothetical protein